jgi:hypothetical protein
MLKIRLKPEWLLKGKSPKGLRLGRVPRLEVQGEGSPFLAFRNVRFLTDRFRFPARETQPYPARN